MTNNQNPIKYDLEDRTLRFAKQIVNFCKKLPANTINFKLIDQLIRSAGSIGANYREANDSLSKKDFIHRLRITRKEAKETVFWLELVKESNKNINIEYLIDECLQLRNIFSSIIKKIELKNSQKFG